MFKMYCCQISVSPLSSRIVLVSSLTSLNLALPFPCRSFFFSVSLLLIALCLCRSFSSSFLQDRQVIVGDLQDDARHGGAVVGANLVATSTNNPGSGFTSRVITKPDGDIVEDRLATVAGTYTATAPLKSAGAWVMQLLAFRAAGSPPPAPHAIESGPPLP